MNTLRIAYYILGIVLFVSLLTSGLVELFGGAINGIFLSFNADMNAFSNAHPVACAMCLGVICIDVMIACLKGIFELMNGK